MISSTGWTMEILLSDDHEYTVDGIEKPGVSEILQGAGLIDSRWYNDHACLRGIYVHKAIQIYHKCGLNFKTLDSELRPYVDAYLDFLKRTAFKPILIEKKMHDPIYDYCGTPDLIGYLKDELVIIDIKTGIRPKWVGLQTAAYKRLCGARVENKTIVHRFALELRSNGRWSLTMLSNRKDIEVFLAAVTIHHFKSGRI